MARANRKFRSSLDLDLEGNVLLGADHNWSNEVAYQEGDLVVYMGSAWIAENPVDGTAPADPAWTQISGGSGGGTTITVNDMSGLILDNGAISFDQNFAVTAWVPDTSYQRGTVVYVLTGDPDRPERSTWQSDFDNNLNIHPRAGAVTEWDSGKTYPHRWVTKVGNRFFYLNGFVTSINEDPTASGNEWVELTEAQSNTISEANWTREQLNIGDTLNTVDSRFDVHPTGTTASDPRQLQLISTDDNPVGIADENNDNFVDLRDLATEDYVDDEISNLGIRTRLESMVDVDLNEGDTYEVETSNWDDPPSAASYVTSHGGYVIFRWNTGLTIPTVVSNGHYIGFDSSDSPTDDIPAVTMQIFSINNRAAYAHVTSGLSTLEDAMSGTGTNRTIDLTNSLFDNYFERLDPNVSDGDLLIWNETDEEWQPGKVTPGSLDVVIHNTLEGLDDTDFHENSTWTSNSNWNDDQINILYYPQFSKQLLFEWGSAADRPDNLTVGNKYGWDSSSSSDTPAITAVMTQENANSISFALLTGANDFDSDPDADVWDNFYELDDPTVATDDVLTWNGTSWVPQALPDTSTPTVHTFPNANIDFSDDVTVNQYDYVIQRNIIYIRTSFMVQMTFASGSDAPRLSRDADYTSLNTYTHREVTVR